MFWDQIIASTKPLMPTNPSKLLCEKRLVSAPPVKVAKEGGGIVVDDGVGEVGTVVLVPEVELLVDSMKTPPAMACGETELAFTAAAL